MKILFYGTPDFSVPSLKALIGNSAYSVGAVVTQPDRPAGRGGKIRFSPIKEVALQHNIPVLQPASIRKELPAFIGAVKELGPFDVGVVIAFGQILPVEALTIPKAGSINIHASLLPRWRGAAPIQRAIMAGDRESGVCLMQMEAGLDTGPVFSFERTSIEKYESGGSLHDRLAQLGAVLLERSLPGILSGKIPSVPQSSNGVTYAEKITTKDALINWAAEANTIEHQVRALSPFPGAFSFLGAARLKILNGLAVESMSNSNQSPGTVTFVSSDRLEVQCGVGVLRLLEVQLEGKKRMSIADFLRGTSIQAGTILLQEPKEDIAGKN